MSIRLVDEYGTILLGRSSGEAIRSRVVSAIDNGATVVLDFDEVVEVSPSFADEVFAKLKDDVEGAGKRVEFANLSEELRAFARFVITNRRNR